MSVSQGMTERAYNTGSASATPDAASCLGWLNFVRRLAARRLYGIRRRSVGGDVPMESARRSSAFACRVRSLASACCDAEHDAGGDHSDCAYRGEGVQAARSIDRVAKDVVRLESLREHCEAPVPARMIAYSEHRAGRNQRDADPPAALCGRRDRREVVLAHGALIRRSVTTEGVSLGLPRTR